MKPSIAESFKKLFHGSAPLFVLTGDAVRDDSRVIPSPLLLKCVSMFPYSLCIHSTLQTEHVWSLWVGISLKVVEYPVKSTSQSTYGRMERT